MRRIARGGLRVALALGLLLLLSFQAATVTADQALGGKVRYADHVTVPATETVNSDLYVFGGDITVDGRIHGDLVAFGGTIVVTGTVDGDVIGAGGSMNISGTVGGAVRTAGGDVTISGTVVRDVLVGTGTLTIGSAAKVGGDLVFGAARASMDGAVGGSVEGRAGTYSRGGTVGGTESVTIQPLDQTATTPIATSTSTTILDAIRHFVAVLAFGALGLWLVPALLRRSDDVLRKRPFMAFGAGALVFGGYLAAMIGLLFAMVVLALAFGALTLGPLVAADVALWLLSTITLTVGFALTAAFLGDALVGLALGRIAVPADDGSRWQELGLLAIGAAVVVGVTSLPFIGPIVKLVVITLALGALGLTALEAWRSRHAPEGSVARPAATPTVPTPPIGTGVPA